MLALLIRLEELSRKGTGSSSVAGSCVGHQKKGKDMGIWLYQLTEDRWSPGRYRLEIWENMR
jgi:hypothetical protein